MIPEPTLRKFVRRCWRSISADDLINPPELGILEREIKRVPKGREVVIPLSDKTRGHGSHTVAALWKDQLLSLLKETERKNSRKTHASRQLTVKLTRFV